jgi:hypothetical protein
MVDCGAVPDLGDHFLAIHVAGAVPTRDVVKQLIGLTGWRLVLKVRKLRGRMRWLDHA